MRRSSLPIVGLALGACYLALGASQASASHVSCGDVITEDTTLDSDLDCPPDFTEPKLTIAADGVTLDLGGHFISNFAGVGMLNDGHDDVTIRNGGIGGPAGGGILIRHANGNRLEGLTAGGGGGGAFLDDFDDGRVVRSTFTADTGALILINGSDRNVIERNSVSDGFGLSLSDSDDNVVRRNLLFNTFPSALEIRAGSDNTTVARNEFSRGTCCRGIFVHAETQNTLLVRNQVSGYFANVMRFGDGIQVESPATTLTRNSSNDNEGWGILAVPGVIDGGHNTASGNLVGQCLNVSC